MKSNRHYVPYMIQLNLSGFALSQVRLLIWMVKCTAPKAKSAITGYGISTLNRGHTLVR